MSPVEKLLLSAAAHDDAFAARFERFGSRELTPGRYLPGALVRAAPSRPARRWPPDEEGEVRVAGVRSPTLEAGPEDAREAAVFVHGNQGSTTDWSALVRRAGEHGRAIALDMPGFGQADKPEHFRYTVEGYARHLAGALAELGVDRAHLVLHDFGGPWGLRWAADHPQAFASVTLVNAGRAARLQVARLRRRPGARPCWASCSSGRPPGRCSVSPSGAASRFPLRPGRLDEISAATKDPGIHRAVLRLYRSTPAKALGELRDVLRPLDRPALVDWGVADPYIKVEQAERQRETFPHARVVRLERCGHWPMYDAPDALAGEVVPFLAEQFGAARPVAARGWDSHPRSTSPVRAPGRARSPRPARGWRAGCWSSRPGTTCARRAWAPRWPTASTASPTPSWPSPTPPSSACTASDDACDPRQAPQRHHRGHGPRAVVLPMGRSHRRLTTS